MLVRISKLLHHDFLKDCSEAMQEWSDWRGPYLVSCEIPFQKLTIEGRIVKLIFVLYWNSGSKKNHKTLDKRRFLLYLCQQIIQNKKQ
jgi:hypothetical protein